MRSEPPPDVTAEVFARWRNARRGSGQAERLTNPFWTWMVTTGTGPYQVNEHFGGRSSGEVGPGWTNERYGQSTTELPDGRTVLIGGEHEDYYDPDFFIYNDVIVREPGGAIEIFGYDEDIFPPTDFHSATLIGEQVILIGNLGYPGQRRVGETQVLTLDTADWHIHPIATSGSGPGWISDHHVATADGRLRLSGGQVHLDHEPRFLVENTDEWELDPETWTWRRVTDRGWQQWAVARRDNGPSGLWRLRHMPAEGGDSVIDQLAGLYRPAVAHVPLPAQTEEYNVFRIDIDGTTVRYVEEMSGVRMVIEGRLPAILIDTLTTDLQTKLAELNDHPHERHRLA